MLEARFVAGVAGRLLCDDCLPRADAEERRADGRADDRWRGPAVRSETSRLPLADDSVDGVLLPDVIERVDDDRAVLADAGRNP